MLTTKQQSRDSAANRRGIQSRLANGFFRILIFGRLKRSYSLAQEGGSPAGTMRPAVVLLVFGCLFYAENFSTACRPSRIASRNDRGNPPTVIGEITVVNGTDKCIPKQHLQNVRSFNPTSRTVGGLTCQHWRSQSPHKHQFGDTGEHNHCSNPDNNENGPWCYTTDPNFRHDSCYSACRDDTTAATIGRLRVMTFNIAVGGSLVENGLAKIAKHISAVNPDIVALQEVVHDLSYLRDLLGPHWSYAVRNHKSYPDTAVLTRHRIVDRFDRDGNSVRARIEIQFADRSLTYVNLWSVHFDYGQYGPYAACRNGTTAPDLEAAEINWGGGGGYGRIQNVVAMSTLVEFKRDLHSPPRELMIVAGDLNCPSHLDWIPETSDRHCGWSYEWPVTRMIARFGLIDAYRRVHPDPRTMPGDTWSPVIKGAEPQDRIDMVFYKGSRWTPTLARVYSGNDDGDGRGIEDKLMPDHRGNDWPSDHASVIVDFVKSP